MRATLIIACALVALGMCLLIAMLAARVGELEAQAAYTAWKQDVILDALTQEMETTKTLLELMMMLPAPEPGPLPEEVL